MPPLANLLAFALTALVIVVIPGPSVMFVIGRSLSLGRRGGLLSVVGNALGFIPQVTAVALGIGVVVAQSMVLFSIIKFAGAAYLVYLGVQAIRHRLALVSEEGGVSARSPKRMSRMRATGGVMMIGLGGTLAFTGSKS